MFPAPISLRPCRHLSSGGAFTSKLFQGISEDLLKPFAQTNRVREIGKWFFSERLGKNELPPTCISFASCAVASLSAEFQDANTPTSLLTWFVRIYIRKFYYSFLEISPDIFLIQHTSGNIFSCIMEWEFNFNLSILLSFLIRRSYEMQSQRVLK